MATPALQFHATQADVMDFALRVARLEGLVPVIQEDRPFRAIRVDFEKGAGVAAEAQVLAVALCQGSPDTAVASNVEFLLRNPECLSFVLGYLTADGLRESAVSGTSANPTTLVTWRRAFRALRREMHWGATVTNRNGGAVHMPRHPHMSGAHALAERGVRMLASAGWGVYQFDDLGSGSDPASL